MKTKTKKQWFELDDVNVSAEVVDNVLVLNVMTRTFANVESGPCAADIPMRLACVKIDGYRVTTEYGVGEG
jgi:hypothetical protein